MEASDDRVGRVDEARGDAREDDDAYRDDTVRDATVSGANAPGSEGGRARVICRHCLRNSVNRPRGLCWHCYYTPGVKAMYPNTSIYARRSMPMDFLGDPAPTAPTRARPGTPEKLEAMGRRAGAGEELFHEMDGRV